VDGKLHNANTQKDEKTNQKSKAEQSSEINQTAAIPSNIMSRYDERHYRVSLKRKNERSQPLSFVFWKKLKHTVGLVMQTVTPSVRKSSQQSNNFL
jgi:hypothetical protein